MSEINIMFATKELLLRFYLLPPKWTLRAICGVRGVEVLGLCGYFLDDARVVLFSDMRPQALHYKKDILRIAKLTLAMALNTGLPVHAINDERYPDAPKLLKHLGFHQGYQGVWVC